MSSDRPAAADLVAAMFEQSRAGFAVFDAGLRRVHANEAFAALRPAEDSESGLRALLAGGENSSVVPFGPDHEATCTVMRSPSGAVLGVSVVVVDVAHRARAERFAGLAELRAEIGTALEATRGTLQRVQMLAELLVPRFADAASVETDDPAGGRVSASAGSPADGGDELSVPLAVRGRALGTLTLARRPGRRPFDADERIYARDIADRSALSIDNERLYESEQETALTLQRSLLAAVGLSVQGIDLAVSYRPTPGELEVAGGDWYDAVARPDGRVVLMVGDVVGHGLPAATVMGQLRSAGRALALTVADPGDLLVHLDAFAAATPGATSATVTCVVVDPRDGALRYASAGHPPPLVVGGNGRAGYLDDGRSVPLASLAPLARPSARGVLEPGATLLLYTDGLVERRGEPIDAGLARLAAALGGLGAESAADMAEKIGPAVLGDARQRDDIAVLVARRA